MSESIRKYKKLRGRIVEVYGSQRAFANKLGKSQQTITAKLADRSQFSKKDIGEWSEALNIPESEVYDFYFA